MICPQCSYINESDAKYCSNCGYPLHADSFGGMSEAPVYGDLVPGIDYGDSTPDVIGYTKTIPVGPADPDRSLAGDVEYMFGSQKKDEPRVDLTGLDRLVDSSNATSVHTQRIGESRFDDTRQMPVIATAMPQSTSFRAEGAKDASSDKGKSPKKALRILGILLLIAALAAAAAVGSYQLGIWGGKAVPDVMGESLANAIYVLEDQGFTVAVEQQRSDDVEGMVVAMDPAAGTHVEEGAVVTIFMSVSRVIPNVIGMDRTAAEAAFEAEGFTSVEFVTVKSDQAEGTVVSVDPGVDVKAKSGDRIVVSLAEPYTVPAVDGMTQDQAVAAIEEAGYQVNVAVHYSEDLPEGSVYGTEPAAEERLDSGSTVTLYIVKSRASECLAYASSYFASTDKFVIGGTNYRIDPASVACEYIGDDTVRYVLSAIEYAVVFGVTVENETAGWQELTGTIVWNNAGDNVGSDPDIRRA